jgi:Rod binding domain-containing protein
MDVLAKAASLPLSPRKDDIPRKAGVVDKKPLDEKTAAAIKDFEGMLLAQMLQSIRESALGGWQEQSDQSGATALEMAEGQLAQMMAANGGLGLAKVLERSLEVSGSPTKTSSVKMAAAAPQQHEK